MSDIESEELRPCPAGHKDIRIRPSGSGHQAYCFVCGWTGPDGMYRIHAGMNWNTRAQPEAGDALAIMRKMNERLNINSEMRSVLEARITALEAALRERDGNGFGKAVEVE